jgi:hypothetical protein
MLPKNYVRLPPVVGLQIAPKRQAKQPRIHYSLGSVAWQCMRQHHTFSFGLPQTYSQMVWEFSESQIQILLPFNLPQV